METKVKFNAVDLVIKDETILTDINLNLGNTGIVALLGRNGAGKSTLMSLLAGFRMQTKGDILIDGQPVFENSASMQQVLFSYPRDLSDTSDKVIHYIEGIAQYRPNFDMAYAEKLIDQFGLDQNKSIAELSKGMQAALEATIGLAANAPITIFDEVYLSMDAPARETLYSEIKHSQEANPRLFIISTHLIAEAEYLFDHIIILDDGRIRINESYDDLIEQGIQVSGLKEEVLAFVQNQHVLHTNEMGSFMSATIFGQKDPLLDDLSSSYSVDIQPIDLQTLFNHLVKKGANHAAE